MESSTHCSANAVLSTSSIDDALVGVTELNDLMKSLSATRKKLKRLGLASAANFLNAIEKLIREYFKCELNS